MIHQKIISLEEQFYALRTPPVIANDLDITSEEGRENLNSMLYTRYCGDSLAIVPACDCGNIRGGYNAGVKCPECMTVCHSAADREIESLLWMRAPDNVKPFVNPTVWIILSQRMRVSGCNLLQWLTDTQYQYVGRESSEYRKLIKAGVERGYNYFHDNFDYIMSVYFCDGIPMTEWLNMAASGQIARPKNIDTVQFLVENRANIFTQYLPMPSKIGLVAESNDSGIYIDSATPLALDALHTIASINNSLTPLNLRRKETRVVKALNLLGDFYKEFVAKTLSGKPGMMRKHIYGNRLHFTARNVITSISGPHEYDELHVPWSTAVQLLDLHITNKLYKRGFTPNQATEFIRRATRQHHPLMREIFDELLAEAPLGGLPVVFQRNPSLARGSAQVLRITKIKDDLLDNTISLSILILVGFNADFDGDEMNLMLILDQAMYEGLKVLCPHENIFDVTKPRKLSSIAKIPTPVAATIDQWLSLDF